MKRLIINFLASLASLSIFGQNDSLYKERENISGTQGEQEDIWMEQTFKTQYKSKNYRRYAGKIDLVSPNVVQYGNNCIILIDDLNKDLRELFLQGIFFPQILQGDTTGGCVKKHILLNPFARIDTLRISNLKELAWLNPSSKVKRFEFYIWRPSFANPSLYVFELTNEEASDDTNLGIFIKASKLTFFRFISILI